MPRSGKQARRRLQEAALALYRKHGYEATTAAEIAAEAGVTERTFFRHFPDKRETLFGDQEDLSAALTRVITDAPDTGAPLAVLAQAFRTLEPVLEINRPFAQPRAEIIAATPALRERQLAKMASLLDTVTKALAARGVPPRQAVLAAQVGMAAFGRAVREWMPDPAADFDALLTEAFHDLRDLIL